MADYQGNAEPEDLADESQYCKHGTYVGNGATGDYMCGWCEDGISDADYRQIRRSQARQFMADRKKDQGLYFVLFVIKLRLWLLPASEGATDQHFKSLPWDAWNATDWAALVEANLSEADA